MHPNNFEIIGDVDKNRLYCAGSMSKLLTTYVCLSKLAEQHDLASVLDDNEFLDKISNNSEAKSFLQIFQKNIGSKFSLRDVCTFYNGLPYTFDLAEDELEKVEQGEPFKHHHLMDEKTLLNRCVHNVTRKDPNHGKFHYSELDMILLGFLIEKIYGIKVEELYQQYLLTPFQLNDSCFSRVKPTKAYYEDLSGKYDYPSIAVTDHGYFCYGNGFFTTLNDEKKLLEQLIVTPIFAVMTDIKQARAASPTIMCGLAVEIRLAGDDILYGYEGMSYSGCNIWAYSTKQKKGFVTFTDDEVAAYDIYQQFGYQQFEKVPDYTEAIYREFIAHEHCDFSNTNIPDDFVGHYHRVKINEKNLEIVFTVGQHYIEIRNPDMIRYDVVDDHGTYRIICKDHMHGIKVGFHRANSGNCYMMYDGTLYRKLQS